MRELTLEVEQPQIKINGILFDLQLSDMEIYSRAQELIARFEKYATRPLSEFMPDETMADVGDAVGFLDEMLGDGAARRISRGRPVRMSLALKWISKIAEEAASHYAELVTGE